MGTYVVRVWLPDRPGALGAVASRIGAVRGDLIGIDILERGGGRAIDELVVALPDDALVPLLLHEMSEVDGVDVEDIRPASDAVHDPRLDALETAALLVDQASPDALLDALVANASDDFEADWAAIVSDDPVPARATGNVPPAAWLRAFVAGSRAVDGRKVVAVSADPRTPESGGTGHGPDDVAWAELTEAGSVLVLGRDRPWRTRERRQLAALARIADRRWFELVRRARQLHPSAAG